MSFVGNEVRQDVPNIEREIAPHIRSTGRDCAAVFTAQRQQLDHGAATPIQGWEELPGSHSAPIDGIRHLDPVLLAQRPDPHAARVVDVTSDHPDGPTWGARHDSSPQLRGEVLHQKDGDVIRGSPRRDKHISQIEVPGHLIRYRRVAPE